MDTLACDIRDAVGLYDMCMVMLVTHVCLDRNFRVMLILETWA